MAVKLRHISVSVVFACLFIGTLVGLLVSVHIFGVETMGLNEGPLHKALAIFIIAIVIVGSFVPFFMTYNKESDRV